MKRAGVVILFILSALLGSQKKFIIGVENIKYLPYYSYENNKYITSNVGRGVPTPTILKP